MNLITSGYRNNYYSSPHFRALTIKPAPKDWNQDVLNAALDSKYVKDFIVSNSAKKEDVTMGFSESSPDEYMPYSFKIMNFTLKSKSQSVSIKSVAKPTVKKHEVVYTDIYDDNVPKDVGKDLASQISEFGTVKSELSQEEKLKLYESLADFEG